MFPGQGSQYVGMGKDILAQFPYSKEIFEEAEDAISVPIKDICFNGPEDKLTETANTQPCILTHSYAVFKILEEEVGFIPDTFMGHSLGEYTALVASKKLVFSEACKLVRLRGEAMQKAVPLGVGAMAAVLKFEESKLKDLCNSISEGTESFVEIVNYNTADQLVVAGHKNAVDKLVEKLTSLEVRAVPLAISAPFHSRLMAPAREEMTPHIEGAAFIENGNQVIANIDAKITSNYPKSHLIKQIDSPVLWSKSMATAHTNGHKTYIEVGPGKVLFGLARKILPRKECNLINTSDLKETINQLAKLTK